jgi:hypothetical protein
MLKYVPSQIYWSYQIKRRRIHIGGQSVSGTLMIAYPLHVHTVNKAPLKAYIQEVLDELLELGIE